MHPAYSVIVFTTASGAGYGLLFWLCVFYGLDLGPENMATRIVALGAALALITAGLVSSTLHLGHPERALGAFSQWRTSWLSREGVAAIATYVPAGLLGLIWISGSETQATVPIAFLAAVGAGITVYCTGMIYASLRTIRHWNLGLVPVLYIALAAATGFILYLFAWEVFEAAPVWGIITCMAIVGATGMLKWFYWQAVDKNPGKYTAEMATGLGHIGTVRPLDPPHTQPNFVMREMGYAVGRKHATKLRHMTAAALFLVPLVLLALHIAIGVGGPAILFLALVFTAFGVVVERWLFFAEAEHVVTLYYGAQRA